MENELEMIARAKAYADSMRIDAKLDYAMINYSKADRLKEFSNAS